MTVVARVMEDEVASLVTERYRETDAEEINEEGGAQQREWSAQIADVLAHRLGAERYDLWFERKTRFILGGNTLFVETPNGFWAQSIRTRFSDDLRTAAMQVLGRPVDIDVRIAQQAGSPPPPPPGDVARRPAVAAKAPPSATVSLRHTLEEFVVGPSNQMAYHAALQVAERPGEQFNPLFIHGHCGLGKTHLLQGICHRFARLHPEGKWLYLTGEQFTNEFLEAIKTHRTEAFRRRIRCAELLVIDDVHFLANKRATQEEFLHTFNHVDAAGSQVVLASDSAPKQIQCLSEQLGSRFVSGMVLRVDSPDLPTRLEILRRRVARSGWQVSDAVLMHIAQTATSSVRELEGLLLQAIAQIELIDRSGADAAGLLASLHQRMAMRGPVPVESILAAVAGYFALDMAALVGGTRGKILSTARSLAMYLTRQHTGMSYPEIGRAMGNKNHSTVIAACQRVQAMITAGSLLCWTSQDGPRHQAISDALHELEAAIRRVK